MKAKSGAILPTVIVDLKLNTIKPQTQTKLITTTEKTKIEAKSTTKVNPPSNQNITPQKDSINIKQ